MALNGSEPIADNGLEAIKFEDVLEYYQRMVTDLNNKLAIAEARVKHRDRVIQELQTNGQGRLPAQSWPQPLASNSRSEE